MSNEEIEARKLELTTQINSLASLVFGQGRMDLMQGLMTLNNELFSLSCNTPSLG